MIGSKNSCLSAKISRAKAGVGKRPRFATLHRRANRWPGRPCKAGRFAYLALKLFSADWLPGSLRVCTKNLTSLQRSCFFKRPKEKYELLGLTSRMSADDKIDIIINPPEGRGQASELLEEPRSRDEDLARLRRELQSRDDELALSRALVTRIYSSWSWRVTLPLRFVRQIAGTIRRQSVRLADGLGGGRLFGHIVFGDGTKSEAREARLPLPSRATSKELETEIQLLQRSGLFDEQFYRQANPDVAAVEISPLAHYLSIGAFEGRRPNRLFDSAYYLRTYSDVAEAGSKSRPALLPEWRPRRAQS